MSAGVVVKLTPFSMDTLQHFIYLARNASFAPAWPAATVRLIARHL